MLYHQKYHQKLRMAMCWDYSDPSSHHRADFLSRISCNTRQIITLSSVTNNKCNTVKTHVMATLSLKPKTAPNSPQIIWLLTTISQVKNIYVRFLVQHFLLKSDSCLKQTGMSESPHLARDGICKERKMQGKKTKLNLKVKKIARNGNCKERNLHCKETILQIKITFFITRLMYVNECSEMINWISY